MAGIFKEHDRLLTTEEVAEILGIKPTTIRKWVFEKRIPFVKFGPGKKSRVMFNPQRLNRWVEELSHEPESTHEELERRQKPPKARREVIERFNKFAADLRKKN